MGAVLLFFSHVSCCYDFCLCRHASESHRQESISVLFQIGDKFVDRVMLFAFFFGACS